jgi:hypothetical protein
MPDAGAENVSAISDAGKDEKRFAQNSARDVLLLRSDGGRRWRLPRRDTASTPCQAVPACWDSASPGDITCLCPLSRCPAGVSLRSRQTLSPAAICVDGGKNYVYDMHFLLDTSRSRAYNPPSHAHEGRF